MSTSAKSEAPSPTTNAPQSSPTAPSSKKLAKAAPLPGEKPKSVLWEELGTLSPYVAKAAVFSIFINFLALVPTVYMLETYDRVVNSRSIETLLWLTVALVIGLVMMEGVEIVRTHLLEIAGERFDKRMRERLFNATFTGRLLRHPAGTGMALNDLRMLRDFFSSPVLTSVMDLPSGLLFLAIIYMINPAMGNSALIGVIFQFILSIWNQGRTMRPMMEAQRAAAEAQNYANVTLRNAQVIESMGMLPKIHEKWMGLQRRFLLQQAIASDFAGNSQAGSKLIGMLQGSMIMAIGAFVSVYAFNNPSPMPNGPAPLNPSLLIVASILGGRALMPISALVMQWRMIATTWGAYQRLQDVLETIPERGVRMSLPAPNGPLIAEQVVTAAPTNPNPILKGVSCGVHPGQALAIVGPSAAGKSTLAKVLLGTWPVMNGKVRLDGADIHSWNKDELGPYLGYLPQEIELFDGTIADNIARFGTPDPELLADAVKLAGLDHVVDALADGLNTEIGDLGGMLSGGQRQRVGLARAVYGRPKLVVLDEPNASLDERGEKALLQAIVELKARGTIVVIVTHRTDILQVVDLMLVLRDGQTQAFGPKDQVLAALKKAADEQRAKMEEARARAEQARLEAPSAGEPAQGASA